MNQKNNTVKLQKQISKLLSDSEVWVALRLDSKGNVHAHMPNEDHLHLLGVFLHSNPEINNLIQEYVKELNKL